MNCATTFSAMALPPTSVQIVEGEIDRLTCLLGRVDSMSELHKKTEKRLCVLIDKLAALNDETTNGECRIAISGTGTDDHA
jgi:hypothetical protein